MPTNPMTLATGIHSFQTLILSFHPVIVIEIVEEERVQAPVSRREDLLQLRAIAKERFISVK